MDRIKVVPVLMEKCPGADMELTRRIIDETLGRVEAKPKHDSAMDAVFTVTDPPADAVARIIELCRQIIDAAAMGTEELYNVLASNMQSLRSAAKKLKP